MGSQLTEDGLLLGVVMGAGEEVVGLSPCRKIMPSQLQSHAPLFPALRKLFLSYTGPWLHHADLLPHLLQTNSRQNSPGHPHQGWTGLSLNTVRLGKVQVLWSRRWLEGAQVPRGWKWLRYQKLWNLLNTTRLLIPSLLR